MFFDKKLRTIDVLILVFYWFISGKLQTKLSKRRINP